MRRLRRRAATALRSSALSSRWMRPCAGIEKVSVLGSLYTSTSRQQRQAASLGSDRREKFAEISHSRAATLLINVVLMTACGQSNNPTELKSGDPDYPATNPAGHALQLIASIPPTLNIRFETEYIATDLSCRRQVGLGGRFPYGVHLPTPVERDGETYRGAVALDGVLPGRCGWGNGILEYLVDDTDLPPNVLVRYSTRTDLTADVKISLWCVKTPKDMNPQRPTVCHDLVTLSEIYPRLITPDFLGSVAKASRREAPDVLVGPNAQSITVEFHDVDALLHRGSRS